MDVTKDKVSSVFFQYAIPSVLGMLAVSSASIVDGFFVGNFIGTSGLAAINISLPIFSFLFGLSLMLAIGGSVVSGKLIGEGDTKNASIIFSKTLLSITILSLTICTILLLNIEDILHLFGATDELTSIAVEYLFVILFFMPFLMIGVVLDYFVKIDNRPKLAFMALFLSAVINMILDWVFIFYLEQGIFGAALATGISQLALIFILLPHFFSKQATLKFIKPVGSYIQIIKAAGNGLSEFVNEISVGITTLIFNYIMIVTFGVEGIAAFTIINYILWVGVMISFGISDSLQPIISKNFGAKKPYRIEEFLKLAFIYVAITGFIMIALITLLPNQLATIFLGDSNNQARQIALDFAMLVWPVFLFNGVNLTISAYFTAVHKPLPSAIISVSRSLIFPLFFIFTLPLFFGNSGIFLAIPIAELFTFIIAIILFRKMSPIKIIK
ncbi:MAG: MATE family efflux transporter [Sulfurospirillum sp.]|nr:MATE family efflux transporter [Sulfurospirillum sp.]